MLLSHGNGADDNPGVSSVYPHDSTVFAVIIIIIVFVVGLLYFLLYIDW